VSASGWPDGIVELCSWPQRTAVLLADRRHQPAEEGLRRLGFTTVVVGASRDQARLAALDLFAFVLVTPEVLVQQDGLDMLQP